MHASIEKHKCRGCYKDRSLYTNQMPVSLPVSGTMKRAANVNGTMYVCLCSKVKKPVCVCKTDRKLCPSPSLL